MYPSTHLDKEKSTRNNTFDVPHSTQTGRRCTPIFEKKDDQFGRSFRMERGGSTCEPLGSFLFNLVLGNTQFPIITKVSFHPSTLVPPPPPPHLCRCCQNMWFILPIYGGHQYPPPKGSDKSIDHTERQILLFYYLMCNFL